MRNLVTRLIILSAICVGVALPSTVSWSAPGAQQTHGMRFPIVGGFPSSMPAVGGAPPPVVQVVPLQSQRCQLATGGNRLDFGRIQAATIKDANGRVYNAGSRSMSLLVTCAPGARFIAIKLIATQSRQSGSRYVFGNEGMAAVKVRDVTLDGKKGQVALVDVAGQEPQSWSTDALWSPGKILVLGLDNKTYESKQATVQISVEAELDKSRVVAWKPLQIDGNLSFELWTWAH
jgi:hypothetical protein